MLMACKGRHVQSFALWPNVRGTFRTSVATGGEGWVQCYWQRPRGVGGALVGTGSQLRPPECNLTQHSGLGLDV